jgi:hypothetical protein
MKYVTPIGVPKEEGGGKMVFLVIVCIDSYIYTRKKMPTPLYGGCPPLAPPTIIFLAPNPIETHKKV